MERELMELFDAARKAADLAAAASDAVSSKGPEVSRCVDALNRLKTFPVTYDILVSTQLERKLRPLTKHPTEKIHRMASDLLELWKKIVIEEASKSEKNGTASAVKVEKIQRLTAVKVPNGGSTKHVKVEKNEADGNTAMAEKINRRETGNIKKIYIDGKSKAKSAPKATTDPFKCGRCGKRHTSFYQMQTRSADEPRTTYVTCVNCNNQWEFCWRNPDYPSFVL
ncbi:hypothetical protein J1N35_012979 [Gossypium stocksii]|uniref:TFIIS N-terminal domain-containing protein n=1 Tax=Gossypium stocksii TaxID=47602 RepID=A0A9D3VSV1_9ROSI|nr:hypothetical protein J1N35_012979 [Gossypium stocksii]